MTRPIRIEFPGAFYHVMSHGNGRQWLYRNSFQIELFVRCLREIGKKYQVLIHAAVLMRNHYHLLVATPKGNLSSAIGRLNSEFARLLNRRLKRKGSIFQKRFKSILVDADEYYSALIRYVYQNPVRVGITDLCESYPGSSLSWWSDKKKRDVISWEALKLPYAGSKGWFEKLIEYVNMKMEPSPYPDKGRINMMGTKQWAEEVRRKSTALSMKEKSLKKIMEFSYSSTALNKVLLHVDEKDRRDVTLLLRFRNSGQSIEEIRKAEGIKSYHAVTQRIYRLKKRIETDPILKRIVMVAEKKLGIIKS